jgi:signal transduction histidine kinase
MSFRARLVLAFGVLAVGPLAVFAIGTREAAVGRLEDEYIRRVDVLIRVIETDLEEESESIAVRLRSLAQAILDDNRIRMALLQASGYERDYLLDYAGGAMKLAGLSMLQIQDGDGRILSSGHFRNEYDRLDPGLPEWLASAPGGAALTVVRAPDVSFLALVRADSLQLGDRRFTIIGGVDVDRPFLIRMAREGDLAVSLEYPGGLMSSNGELQRRLIEDPERTLAGVVMRQLPVTFLAAGGSASARFMVTHSRAPMVALRRTSSRWFLIGGSAAAVVALLLAAWLSARISRPIAALGRKATLLDLDRLDVDFGTDRTDEIGALSRRLGEMTDRMRDGAGALREAERRAAIGDLSRQVTHDIRNGLVPLRNVLQHLGQLSREEPSALPSVFDERRETLDSSLSYLESLAAGYGRLRRETTPERCDVNEIVRQLVDEAPRGDVIRYDLALDPNLPPVSADKLSIRRVLKNLVANAAESLEGAGGTVTISTGFSGDGHGERIRVSVGDTGVGMSSEQCERAFEPFYTTRESGTGLGLSIVRRLVTDLGGSVSVESRPGEGSIFMVDMPVDERTAVAPDR